MTVTHRCVAVLVCLCACPLMGCDKGSPSKEEVMRAELDKLRTSIRSMQPEGQAKPEPGSYDAFFLDVFQSAIEHLEGDTSLEKPYLLGALFVLPSQAKAGDSGQLYLYFLEYETWTMGVLAWTSDLPPEHGWLLPLFAEKLWTPQFERLRKQGAFWEVTVDVLLIEAQDVGATVLFHPGKPNSFATVLLPAQFVGANLGMRLYDQKGEFSNTVRPMWVTEEEARKSVEQATNLGRSTR